jgi:hypothetical protein
MNRAHIHAIRARGQDLAAADCHKSGLNPLLEIFPDLPLTPVMMGGRLLHPYSSIKGRWSVQPAATSQIAVPPRLAQGERS